MACFTDDIGPLAYVLASATGRVAGAVVKQSWGSFLMDGARSIGALAREIPVPVMVSSRTGMEQMFLASAGAYVSWQAYRLGVFSFVGKHSSSLVPGVERVKRLFKPLELAYDTERCTRRSNLESRRDGSEETFMTFPKSQCQIGFKRDGKFVVIGCAVRFAHGVLVGPDHVLSDEDLEEKFAYGSQSTVSLKGKERIALDTDLVMIKLTDKEFSTIGIAECRITGLNDSGALAQIVGPEKKGTLGRLIHDKTIFGRVLYEGTTLAGYSGSIYASGHGTLGLHQMGGVVNSGYSASYVWMLVRQVLGLRFEDSDDWLMGQYKSGKRLKWNHHGDPEFVQVCVNGLYSTVKTASMTKAFGNKWSDSDGLLEMSSERAYGDYESRVEVVKSGEASSSMHLGVLSLQENSQASSQLIVPSVIAEYNKLSKKQQLAFRKSLGLQVKQMSVTNGPESVLQPVSTTA